MFSTDRRKSRRQFVDSLSGFAPSTTTALSAHVGAVRFPMRFAGLAAMVLATIGLVGCGGAPIKVIEEPSLKAGKRIVEYQHGGQLFALKSGMQMLVVPDDGTNLVKVDMRYRVGSIHDPAGRMGLAHLVEHLSFNARSTASADAQGPIISQKLGEDALTHNAFTSWDYTHYTAMALSDQLQSLMTLEARRMRATCEHIDEALLQREREVVRNELRQRQDAGMALAGHFFRDVYGEDHPYGRLIGGSDTELAAVTRADVCEFLDRHYQPGNAILVVSGNVNIAQAKKLFGRLFSRIKGTPVAKPSGFAAPALRGTSSQHALPVTEAAALIAFNAPAFGAHNSAYERLARNLLRRRMWEVRQQQKTITSLSVSEAGGPQAPLTVISVAVSDPAKLRDVVGAIQKRTDDLLWRIDDDVLGHTKERVRASFLRSIEPFAQEADLFADYLQYTDHIKFAIAELEQFDSMSRAAFASYLTDRYRPQDSHVVYISRSTDSPPTARRAELNFSPSDYELPDWRTAIDLDEANRDLTLPGTRLRAPMRTFRLQNGMKVIAVPGLGHPVVDIRLVFPGGRLHEPPGKAGIAGLAAELLERDPKAQFRSHINGDLANRLLRAIHRMGGTLDNEVGELTTTFRSSGLSMYADGLLWQLYWLARTGYYGPKTFALFRDQARRRAGDASIARKRARRALEAVYGTGHPYARIEPESAVYDRVAITDLEQFRDAHFHAGDATLIISGEFDADFVLAQVRRLFGSLPARTHSPPPLHAVGRLE